jgi:hypothetical protein
MTRQSHLSLPRPIHSVESGPLRGADQPTGGARHPSRTKFVVVGGGQMAYYGGIILGCLLLLGVLIVFVINKKLEFGGIVLTLVGFSLFGLPVWKSLDVNPKQGQFHVELRVLEQRTSSPSSSPPDLRPSVISAVRYKVWS